VSDGSAVAPPPEAGRWREPPEPRAVLRAAGVARSEALNAAHLHDLSRSHALTLVQLPDGSAYVVKRVSRDAHDAGRSLAAELYAYRVASWRADFAAVLPTAVHVDERRQVLALVAAPPEQLFYAQYLSPGFPGRELGAALGRALATVHTATTGIPLLTVAACGVVALPDTPEEHRRIGGESEAARTVANAVIADAELAEALRRTAAALVPACLIHADVKWDNVVMDPGPPARVLLFDWELSGRGDPAWDLGSAVADSVSLTARLSGASALDSDPVQWLDPTLTALLAAYGDACELAGSSAFAERVTGCWVARSVHLALECAASLEDPDHAAVREVLEVARRLASRHEAVATAVRRALGARA